MADKEPTNKVVKTETTQTTDARDNQNRPIETSANNAAGTVNPTAIRTPEQSRRRTIWLIVACVAAYVILMAIVFGIFFHNAFNHLNNQTSRQPFGNQMYQRGRLSGDRSYNVRQQQSDGLTTTTTTTTYTQTEGVITAVNTDSVVVAGGGKTQTIKTNGSTQYVNNVKPAVNDTVVVTGTKSGDTLTATQVAVYN